MTAAGPSPEWIERLQGVVNDTVERATASTANFQRLLAAVSAPGYSPDLLASELSRWGTAYGPDAYRHLAGISTRFLSRSVRVVSWYRDEYLRELLPRGRLQEAGSPEVPPPPPDNADAADWTAWYPLYTAWVSDQQAWAARLYRILLEEVAAGALRPEDVQAAARDFMQRRLPDYLVEMAELNGEFVSDLLSLADSSLGGLSEAVAGRPEAQSRSRDADQLQLDLAGPPGSTTQARLAVENKRGEHATVRCIVTPAEGFDLATAPREFELGPGESRDVTIRVGLPDAPAGRAHSAGSVVIRGQGETDLVVQVLATVQAPPDEGVPSNEDDSGP